MNTQGPINDYRVREAIQDAKADYRTRTAGSLAMHQRAEESMPGGNTRSVLFYDPYPLVMKSGKDATLQDVDENEYLDFLGEYTAGLYGHSHPTIQKSLINVITNGISFGSHNDLEVRFAEALRQRYPAMERLRFTNSGTEANLMALTLARMATSCKTVLVFAGAYHGAVFAFPGAGGSPTNVPFRFVVGSYNDAEEASRLIHDNASDLAAVIVEPMLGAGGCIPATDEFLQVLRDETLKTKSHLILDEVMTSRLAYNGLQSAYQISPDLMTVGKYLGGGMSFGAFGGAKDLMAWFDPRTPGSLAHAGTFNNNVLTMAAGIAGLEEVLTEARLEDLNVRGAQLRSMLNETLQRRNKRGVVTGVGSVMTIHLGKDRVENAKDVALCDQDLKELMFLHFLSEGIYVARRLMISLSLPITDLDCQKFAATFDGFFDLYGQLVPDRE